MLSISHDRKYNAEIFTLVVYNTGQDSRQHHFPVQSFCANFSVMETQILFNLNERFTANCPALQIADREHHKNFCSKLAEYLVLTLIKYGYANTYIFSCVYDFEGHRETVHR